jgi:hypothetical protein
MQYGDIPVIIHPSVIKIDEDADRYAASTLFKTTHLLSKMKKLVKSVLPQKLYELITG